MFGTKLLVLTLPFHHLEFYPGCACCSTLLQQAVHGFSRACACTCVPTLVARFPRAFAYGADNLYIHNSMTILDPRLAVRGCSRETESGVGHRQTGLLQAAPPGARHPSQRRHTETSTLEV